MTSHDSDPFAAVLRQAMETETAMVQPAGDGLSRIRARTSRRRGWGRALVLSGATAGALGLVAGGVYAAVVDRDGVATAPTPAQRPSALAPAPSSAAPAPAPASTSAPGNDPATSPAPSASTAPTGPTQSGPETAVRAVVVPVYYTAAQPTGQIRLFREFQSRPAPRGAAHAAITRMFGNTAADADYRSLWPAATRLRSYAVSGGTATVDVDAAPRASIAVQQLVYTVTAADRRVQRVRLQVNGTTRGTYARAPRIDVEGLIWLLAPAHDAQVPRTFSMSGIASTFEANVEWEVRQGSRVVRRGFTTAAEAGPARASWSQRLTLPPGTYELRVFATSAEDGKRLLAIDTKTVVVR